MRKNKAREAAQENSLLAALAEHFSGSAVLTLNGTSYKAKDLQKVLQAHLDAISAADALKAKWQTAVATADAKAAKVAGLLPALRAHLISEFGGSSQTVEATPSAEAWGRTVTTSSSTRSEEMRESGAVCMVRRILSNVTSPTRDPSLFTTATASRSTSPRTCTTCP